MELIVKRTLKSSESSIGELSINGKFECFTLEDREREIPGKPVQSWKVAGETAIPKGRYRVIINMSNRFKQMMPLLLNVPGFEGIRIHPGNTAKDTEGCILVGRKRGFNSVGDSRTAYSLLFSKLSEAVNRKEDIFITIE